MLLLILLATLSVNVSTFCVKVSFSLELGFKNCTVSELSGSCVPDGINSGFSAAKLSNAFCCMSEFIPKAVLVSVTPGKGVVGLNSVLRSIA